MLLCVCLVLTGCQGGVLGDDRDDTAEPTTLEPLREPAVHPGLTAGLQVVVSTDERVRVTGTEQSNRGTVYDETFTERGYVRFDDGRVFCENGAYDVVLRVNGAVQWGRTVRHYESYDLRVVDSGSVVVESHATA